MEEKRTRVKKCQKRNSYQYYFQQQSEWDERNKRNMTGNSSIVDFCLFITPCLSNQHLRNATSCHLDLWSQNYYRHAS